MGKKNTILRQPFSFPGLINYSSARSSSICYRRMLFNLERLKSCWEIRQLDLFFKKKSLAHNCVCLWDYFIKSSFVCKSHFPRCMHIRVIHPIINFDNDKVVQSDLKFLSRKGSGFHFSNPSRFSCLILGGLLLYVPQH